MNGDRKGGAGTGNAELPLRYEIRRLKLEHLDWAKALFAHSFVRLDSESYFSIHSLFHNNN